jgi:hypothetical protein
VKEQTSRWSQELANCRKRARRARAEGKDQGGAKDGGGNLLAERKYLIVKVDDGHTLLCRWHTNMAIGCLFSPAPSPYGPSLLLEAGVMVSASFMHSQNSISSLGCSTDGGVGVHNSLGSTSTPTRCTSPKAELCSRKLPRRIAHLEFFSASRAKRKLPVCL